MTTYTNLTSYPTRNLRLATYVVGWWVMHRETERLGRITDTRQENHRGSNTGARYYRVWWPAAAKHTWHSRMDLTSATQMQANAAALHPDQNPPAKTTT